MVIKSLLLKFIKTEGTYIMKMGVYILSGAAARTGKFKKKRKSNIRNYKIRGECE